MDSDLIRREINQTSERIEETLRELDARANAAARRAARVGLLALAGVTVVAASVMLYAWTRRSSRARTAKHEGVRAAASERRRLGRGGRLVGMPGRGTEARAST